MKRAGTLMPVHYSWISVQGLSKVGVAVLDAPEKKMREDELIVSKTDTKGRITYGNNSFISFSGYEESQLIGQPHNIIRHPDMPRAVYRFMWETLQGNKEFFGIIKNQCQDGSFYWAFANVTPSYDNDRKLVGYFSVRRYPKPELIDLLTPVYQKMCQLESAEKSAKAGMDASGEVLSNLVAAAGGYNEFICSHYK